MIAGEPSKPGPPHGSPSEGPGACHALRQELTWYLEGELRDPAACRRVRAHLVQCEECGRYAEHYDQLTRALLSQDPAFDLEVGLAVENGGDESFVTANQYLQPLVDRIMDRVHEEDARRDAYSAIDPGPPIELDLEPRGGRGAARHDRLRRLSVFRVGLGVAAAVFLLGGLWFALPWSSRSPGDARQPGSSPSGWILAIPSQEWGTQDRGGAPGRVPSDESHLRWIIDRVPGGGGTEVADAGRILKLYGFRKPLEKRLVMGADQDIEWVVEAALSRWKPPRFSHRFFLVPDAELVLQADPQPSGTVAAGASGRIAELWASFGDGVAAGDSMEITPVAWREGVTSLGERAMRVARERRASPCYRVYVLPNAAFLQQVLPLLPVDRPRSDLVPLLRSGSRRFDSWAIPATHQR